MKHDCHEERESAHERHSVVINLQYVYAYSCTQTTAVSLTTVMIVAPEFFFT